jgi:hypothetical protein
MALPSNLNYGNKPETASARSYTSMIQPEGAMSGYTPNSTIKFNIPCQANTVLVSSETYLKLTLSNILNGAAVNNFIRLDGAGIQGIFQRIRVYHGSTEINDIDNYGNFAKSMMAAQQPSDAFSSKQNVMSGTFGGYNSSTAGVAFCPLVGEKLHNTAVETYGSNVPIGVPPWNAAGTNGSIPPRDYATSLICYVGTLGGDKYVPCYEMTSAPLRLELQLVNSLYKFLTSNTALIDNFRVDNLELACSFIELSDEVIATLRQRQLNTGSPLQYVVPNYSNVSANATIFNAVETRVTHQLSARYASLKSILCTLRAKPEGGPTFFPLNSTHFDLRQWRFRIGSQLIPSKQISSHQESYAELMKALGSIADLNHEPSISYRTYATDAIPVACAELNTGLHATTKSNSFIIGLDLETYATADRDKLWAGMNTLTSDVFLNADFGGSIGGADQQVRFDFYSMYDQILVFENQSVRVVK